MLDVSIPTFGGAKDPVEGRLDTGREDALVFTATHKPLVGERISIP